MSKKPLVRSKKRAVHTNTKDKLSKLIAEVDSIAKELSKVKKGGLGDMSKMTGGDSIFSKIIKMLEEKKGIISNLKIEYINLLIKGYIDEKNKQDVWFQTITVSGDETIKYINNEWIKLYVSYYNYNMIQTNDNKIKDFENIKNIKNIARILNIYRNLYLDIKEDMPTSTILNTYNFKLNSYFTAQKAAEILIGNIEHGNIANETINAEMGRKKNDLMNSILQDVMDDRLKEVTVLTSLKQIYTSLNEQKMFEYDNLKASSDLSEEILKQIDKLNEIKLKYHIYFFIFGDDFKNNVNGYDKIFSFDKHLLGDENIDTIEKLKRAIKGLKTIQTVDEKRTKINFQMVTRFFRDKGQFENIETILKNLKTDLETITSKRNSHEENKRNINEDPKAKAKDKLKKITQLNDEISNLNKNITKRIDELNNIKDALILDYNDKNNVTETDEKNKIVEMFKRHFFIKLKDIGFEDKYLEHFISDNSDNKNTTVSTDSSDSTVETDESKEEELEGELGKRLKDFKKTQKSGGKLTTKYKSTGESVYILYKRKKIKRCVYVKAKGRGKYCKVDGEYKLLSKLKIM
jgi:hypothetical protein